jgi:hypothetical protein
VASPEITAEEERRFHVMQSILLFWAKKSVTPAEAAAQIAAVVPTSADPAGDLEATALLWAQVRRYAAAVATELDALRSRP